MKWQHFVRKGNLNFIFPFNRATVTSIERCFPVGRKEALTIYYGEEARWYQKMDDLLKLGNLILDNVRSNKISVNKLCQDILTRGKNLLQFSKNLKQKSLSVLTNREIEKIIKKLKLLKDEWSISYITDALDIALSEYLLTQLKIGLRKLKIKEKENDFNSNLIVPAIISLAQREKIDIYKLAFGVKKSKKNITDNKIKKIYENYRWLGGNFVGDAEHSIIYYQKEVAKISKLSTKKLINEIDKWKNFEKQIKSKRGEILERLNLNADFKSHLEIFDKFAKLNDERKRYLIEPVYYQIPLYKEIAKRFGILERKIKWLTDDEIIVALDGLKVDKKMIDERSKFCVEYHLSKKYKILTGIEGKQKEKKEVGDIVDKEIEMIKGTSASKGKTRGQAKIIKEANQLNKLNKGDILVASMTTPDYVVGIKRAVAIITDEGGMMCHAAIVSRELGIACIVGTKIATKVLKDGDLIEVDANKGVVKIIKKAK